MAKQETRIKLKAVEGHADCPVHKEMVDVILGLDKRLGRMEIILIVAAAGAVGSFGKEILLPLMMKLIGA